MRRLQDATGQRDGCDLDLGVDGDLGMKGKRDKRKCKRMRGDGRRGQNRGKKWVGGKWRKVK